MTSIIVATRRFTAEDQQDFAALSGDRNPIHLDPIAARRTLAGAPILFGIQTLLWALDCFLRDYALARPVRSLAATFSRFVHVGETVQAILQSHSDTQAKLQVLVNGVVAVRITIDLGEPANLPLQIGGGVMVDPFEPLDPPFDTIAGSQGSIPLSGDADAIGRMYPSAHEALGHARIAALARSSFLVGMVCPGLHSLYDSLALSTVNEGHSPGGLLAFTAETDARFARVRLDVAGGGWAGSLVAFRRPEPVAQPSVASLTHAVAPDAFAGRSALVVGGSRGLGELVAKLIVAGGGRVTVTYAAGETDARRLQTEVAAFGGRCDIVRYDVREEPDAQLDALVLPVDLVFYMPTPPIFTKRGALFEPAVFAAFLSFYVSGFYALCLALRKRGVGDIPILYPSSTAIDQRPRDLTEYAMAKAAGEQLCADMRAFDKFKAIRVVRLPRVSTDQTASLRNPETFDAGAILLPIIEAMRDECRGA